MKAIQTTKAPAAVGPYSQAVESGLRVYVSGQLPIDPETREMKEGCIKCKTRQSLTNIRRILEEAELSMKDVVKVTILLTDINDFSAVNEVYSEFFEEPYPARSAFAVAALPLGSPIEIEAIAEKDVKAWPFVDRKITDLF